MADVLHPVEQVVDLVHDVTVAGRGGRACGKLAGRVTLGYLDDIRAGRVQFHCNGCFKRVTLDQVTGDEPFTPAYQPPKGGI